MATYGKSYQLCDESETDIGSPTCGDGTMGMYTKQNVR